VEIRDPAMPENPQPSRPRAVRPPAQQPPAEETPVDSVRYRVDGRFTAVKIAGFVIFALAALAFHDDRAKLAFTSVAALVAGGYALRDVLAPYRLSADRDGVSVTSGYAGTRRLAWSEIERVRLDERRRLGTRSAALEIDTGDHLYLLSAYDLATDPADAVEALNRLRPSTDPSATG
jgi:hypothetical protein